MTHNFRAGDIEGDSVCFLYPAGSSVLYSWDLANNNKSIPHRIGAPAVLWKDGGYVYYYYGQRHRLEGAAIWFPTGESVGGAPSTHWYLFNKEYTEEEHTAHTTALNLLSGVDYDNYLAYLRILAHEQE